MGDSKEVRIIAPLINQAKAGTFLIAGSDKSSALREVLEGHPSAESYPSKLIHPTSARFIWLVDQAAAADLSRVSV